MLSDFKAVLEALKSDPHDLICEILPQKNIGGVLKDRGFELEEEEIAELEKYVKKMRTYITDQIHVMELKVDQMSRSKFETFSLSRIRNVANSGNSAVNW